MKKSFDRPFVALGMSCLLVVGCAGSENLQGYIFDSEVLEELRPGVDDRLSVQSAMGNPSARSTFRENTWYYVNQVSRKRAFFNETIVGRTVVQINFDDEGYLDGVTRYTLADGNNVNPRNDKTPSRGRTLNFFQQVFSNIGRFNAGGAGGQPGG